MKLRICYEPVGSVILSDESVPALHVRLEQAPSAKQVSVDVAPEPAC